MSSLAIHALNETSTNATLTARTTKVLSRVVHGAHLDARGLSVVKRAADFLQKILQGSALVENKEIAGVAPSHEGLRDYVRTLTVLRTLGNAQDASSEAFSRYHDLLLRMTRQEELAPAEMQELRAFFSALSTSFFAELTRPILEKVDDGRFTGQR
jgi:hypothetical protein